MTTLLLLSMLAPAISQSAHDTTIFDYDREAPLRLEYTSSTIEDGIQASDVTFTSLRGGLVPAWLVEPLGEGPFGAIVFMHKGGAGGRNDFLDEAKSFAHRGFISILIDAPYLRPEPPPALKDDKRARAESDLDFYSTLVVDLRRAADVVESLPNVDASRIGFIGHSLGATWGGALAGFESRFRAFVLIAGESQPGSISGADWYSNIMRSVVGESAEEFEHYERVTDRISPHHFLPRAPGDSLLLQFGRSDEKVARHRAEKTIEFAGPSQAVRWYETNHDFEHHGAREERAEWLTQRLRR